MESRRRMMNKYQRRAERARRREEESLARLPVALRDEGLYPPCASSAWVNTKTTEAILVPECSELWDPETERKINSGMYIPHDQWVQKNTHPKR